MVLALHNNMSGHQYDIVGHNPIVIDNKYLFGIHRTELVLNLADTTEHTVQKGNRFRTVHSDIFPHLWVIGIQI